LKPAVDFPAAPSCPPGRALAALRGATREHHNRIDRLMDLRRMGDPAHYARVLQALAAFLGPWEAAVRAPLAADAQAWVQARSRRHFLQRDLAALGIPALEGPGPALHFTSAAAAWGSLYVLEGSALGGQVITRALAHHGLRPDHGCAYFNGWGAACGRHWQEFRARLEVELAHPACTDAACTAACHTFDALAGLLESLLHERPALA
jgi:heme oxygenase